jgi:hypothetical protein
MNENELSKHYLKTFREIMDNSFFDLENKINELMESDFRISRYEDKDKHITHYIFGNGIFLLENGFPYLSEIYWHEITQKTREISKKVGFEFNCGLSLANEGVSQLALGKDAEGMQNIYLAYAEDKETVRKNINGDVDVEHNFLKSILFKQFYKSVMIFLFNELVKDQLKSDCDFSDQDFIKWSENFDLEGSIYLYIVARKIENSIRVFNLRDSFISRGYLMDALFGICLWIEDRLKKYVLRKKQDKKDRKIGELLNLILEENKIPKVIFSNLGSSDLGNLQKVIRNIFKNNGILDIKIAKLIYAIRNFSAHNYSLEEHDFFDEIKKYFAYILYFIYRYGRDY